MVERRIMNRPGEKVGGNPATPVAGAENITVKPKTVEERVVDLETYAYGIDPVIRSILAEIGEIKKTMAILNEEVTKIAGVQARSNAFIDGKFEEINNTFTAVISVVKKIDDDYQNLFTQEDGTETEEEPEVESNIEDLYEEPLQEEEVQENEYLSTEPMEEYVEEEQEEFFEPEPEPDPEPEPEPVVKKVVPKPVAKPVAKPVVKPVQKPVQPAKTANVVDTKQIVKTAVKALQPTPKTAAPAMPTPIVKIQQKKVASKSAPLAPETQPRPAPKDAEEAPVETTSEKKGFFGNIFKKKKESK